MSPLVSLPSGMCPRRRGTQFCICFQETCPSSYSLRQELQVRLSLRMTKIEIIPPRGATTKSLSHFIFFQIGLLFLIAQRNIIHSNSHSTSVYRASTVSQKLSQVQEYSNNKTEKDCAFMELAF